MEIDFSKLIPKVVSRQKYLDLKRQVDNMEEREIDNLDEYAAHQSMVDELRFQLQRSIIRSILLAVAVGALLAVIIFLFIKLKKSAPIFVYRGR